MNVCVEVPQKMSRAMYRVAAAIKRHAPSDVTFVVDPKDADLHILHVISHDALVYVSPAPQTIVIQYCLCGQPAQSWWPLWKRARAVWSYYPIADDMPKGTPAYVAPLGIDDAFLVPHGGQPRSLGLLTSGYVAGPSAEAIEEVTRAAHAQLLTTAHLGPVPENASLYGDPITKWNTLFAITDKQLSIVYGATTFVSGLRFVEGFEFPVIEGLSQGARPIVFERPETEMWFDGLAIFVPELQGPDLIWELQHIFADEKNYTSLAPETIAAVRDTFDWGRIVKTFWTTAAEICVG
jgi:hypothetical protein